MALGNTSDEPDLAAAATGDAELRAEAGADEDELCRLVRAAQAGEREAFDELFGRVRPHLFRCVRRWSSANEFDDLLQNVFIEIFRSIPSYRFESRITTWMYRIAIRTAMRSWEKRDRERSGVSLDVVEATGEARIEPTVDDDLAGASEAKEVHRILATLSPKRRMVLVLADLEGRTSTEVAELLGTNSFTVRTRLFYARREFAARAAESTVLAERFRRRGDVTGGLKR
ncbi:MAG: sigma-70 family RNA polymerase sigma factor [Deltaproteobacteria bacterium]|nr:sigma-70 family RNA polymerase sigma factor [Deltaproteobacteria bacterium]